MDRKRCSHRARLLALCLSLLLVTASGCEGAPSDAPDSPPPPSASSAASAAEPAVSPPPTPTIPQTVTLGTEEFPPDSTSLALAIVSTGKRGIQAEELSKLSAFSQLTRLELREDALEEGVPLGVLAAASSLTELTLSFHRGPLDGLGDISQLSQLSLLDCSDSSLSALALDELENCRRLTRLHILDCSGFSLPPLTLEGLYLSRCGDVDWSSLGRLAGLGLLYLDDNFPEDMSFLTTIPGLKSLQMRVHFDLVPDPSELQPLPVALTHGDDIPGWVPGDRAAMADFLEQPDRQILIHLSPFAAADCACCSPA